MIDLNVWHHALHQVTGGMALRFNRAGLTNLRAWAAELHAIASGMEVVAVLIERAETRNPDNPDSILTGGSRCRPLHVKIGEKRQNRRDGRGKSSNPDNPDGIAIRENREKE